MSPFSSDRRRALAALASAALAPLAFADDYPSRQIQVIVPFPPGGANDMLARVVGTALSKAWHVPVVVDNRAGGNTVIGAQAARQAAPDGYTLFLAIDSTLAMNPALYSRLPYDPVRDFDPITQATTMPLVLAVHPGFEARTVAQLVEAARARPGQLSYAQSAIPAQLAGEMLKNAARIDMVGVPYKGSAPAINDVVAGQVPVLVDSLGSCAPFLRAGRLRPLAVTSPRRSPLLPEVPTLAESGFPAIDLPTWSGFLAPAGIAPERRARLHAELTRVLGEPEVSRHLAEVGMEVVASTPQAFAETIARDIQRFGVLIRQADIHIN